MKKQIETYTLYNLCNKHQMFTAGSNSQYDKMFELAKDGITQNELAIILFACSDKINLETINEWIAPLFLPDWRCFKCGTGFSHSDSMQCGEYMGSCVCEKCVHEHFVENDGEIIPKPNYS